MYNRTMIWKSTLKNPILSIGILFFTIFLLDLGRRGKLPWPSEKTKASSCSSVLVMLEKRVPATWSVKCNDNNLDVLIASDIKVKEYASLKPALYRDLANHLIFISKNSLNESLERTLYIVVKVKHKNLEINALTEGKYLAKLAYMKKPEFIAEHLKSTVQTQEKVP